MVNAQDWLDKKYPINGTCQRDNDSENKDKKREEITELDIRKEKVGNNFFGDGKNLTGSLKLESFTNLRKLIVSSHQLIELDVSECKNLIELDCHNNKLNSLKLSGCHHLTKINCFNNHLRELNLDTCTELSELNCTSNNFKELDISKCSELTENAITSDLTYKGGKLIKIVSQIDEVKENDIRNILIVGITGNGKSALANVLTGTVDFDEKSSSTSVTNRFQKSNPFEYQGKKYRVIDNIGFDDTNNLTIADILREIGKGIYSAENKINQILFVISGKFNAEQIKAFNLFKDFISETGITKFNTIVRTNFSNFKDSQKCKEDQESLLAENEELREIIGSCNGIIYVDNPPVPLIKEGIDDEEREEFEDEKSVSEKKRKESREKVLTHLVENCSEIYRLKEWENIYNQIEKCIKNINEKKQKLARAGSSERIKLQSELEAEERKFAEEINATFGVKIGLAPELSAQIEMKNINCCSIS